MQLVKGSRVAFTAKHLKAVGAGLRSADRRGTYQGLDSAIPGYCRVIWDDLSAQSVGDPEYAEMAQTIGELYPVKSICGVKSAAFGDTYA